MAERWFISTKIWRDEYLKELSLEAFKLYMYLHVNDFITYYGVMDYNLFWIADECNLEKGFVESTLRKFKKDDKVIIIEYQIFVKGFMKMTSPRGLNAATKNKLKSDAYKLHPDIHKAVLDEMQEINREKQSITDDTVADTDPQEAKDEEFLALVKKISSTYEYYFGELDTTNIELAKVVSKTCS